MHPLVRAGFPLFRLMLAVVVSFLIFVLVATLHQFVKPEDKVSQANPESRAVEAQLLKKEPPPEKKSQQHFRNVTSASSGRNAGSGERMTIKFSPDLGIDAGPSDGAGVVLKDEELGAEVFEDGQTDEDVVPEATPAPTMPDKARSLGIEGEFVGIIVVGHNGRVTSVETVKSPHPSITAEVMRVTSQWKFKPARNKGVPVSVRKRIVYDFKLES